MKKYRIEQNLTDGEVYKLSVRIMLKAKMIKRVLFIAFLPFTIVLLISLLLLFVGGSAASIFDTWQMLIFPLIISLLVFGGPLFTIKLKKFESPVYEFDDWNMTVITSKRNVDISWGEITHYTELRNYILITLGRNDLSSHIIPKRGFKDNEEVKEFLKFLIDLGLKKR